MITTTEVSRAEWTSFLDSLSRLHVEEPVSVEVLRLDIGAQLEVLRLPLEGIAADMRGAHSTITIACGSALDRHISHSIYDPLRVRLLRGPAGDDEALEIEAADESKTLVLFEGPKGWPG